MLLFGDVENDAPFVVIENGKAEVYFKIGKVQARKFFFTASIFEGQAEVRLGLIKRFEGNTEVFPVDFRRDEIPRPH